MSTWAEPRQLALLADPLDERFAQFHHANPNVYRALVNLARQWRSAGNDKCSMDMLFHLLRWEYGISTKATDGLLLNNSYTSRYARLIHANEPDLRDIFNTRSLKVDREYAI